MHVASSLNKEPTFADLKVQREKLDNFMESFYNLLNKCDSSTFSFKGIGEREKTFNIY